MSYFCIVNNFWIVVWFVSAKFCFSHIRKYSQQFSLITDKLIKWIKFIFGFLGLRQSQKLRFIDVCCSVAKSSPTLCNPMDCNMLGFPVLRYLHEFAQTQVCWVGDAIQQSSVSAFFSCPQSFPASGSFPVYQLFASGDQSIEASASAFHTWQWIFRVEFHYDWLVWSPCCPRTLRSRLQHENSAEFSRSISSSALTLLYGPTLTSVHDYW